jgi:gluconate 5-dehydrogenase
MASMFDELFDMSDDTVLITGGGTGLGRQFAQVLARAGATVILSGRRMENVLRCHGCQ